MEADKTIPSSQFDLLLTKCVPHILETIFFSLDYESYMTCPEVSTIWRELLTSERYVKEAKSLFHDEVDHNEVKKKLSQAVKKGNVKEVQVLSIFVDVNFNVMQLLLERGANSNRKDDSQYTPLLWAAIDGNKDVLQLLLDRGAKPNCVSIHGWTPLHYGASRGQKDVVQLLLNAGAEYNKVNWSGKTALHLTQQNGHLDIVNILNDALIRDQKAVCEDSIIQARRSNRKRKGPDIFKMWDR